MKTKLLVIFLTTAAVLPISAAPLSTQSIKQEVSVCLRKESCHSMAVAYPKTGNKAIDAWGKQNMLAILQDTIEGNLKVNNLNKGSLKAVLRNYITDENGKPILEENDTCKMDFLRQLALEGETSNYAILGLEHWEYTCGAHGNGSHSLLIVPKTGVIKPLKLADIVLPNQKEKLVQLQLAAWKKYLAQPAPSDDYVREKGWTAAEIEEHLQDWKFEGTDNYRFAKDGLVFLFQSYEIAPYSMGRPELLIPSKDLQGIIKPEILRETESYRSYIQE